MSSSSRGVAAGFVLLCAAWYGRVTVAQVLPSLGKPSDFSMYYQAAQNVAAGKSPFVTEGYIYPPLLAELLASLAQAPYESARWIWFLFSQACLLAAAWLMWKALGRDWLAACVIALVWALGGAAVESLALGQPGPVLALLLAIAYSQAGWRQTSAAGIGLAVKLIPGIVAVAFLLRKQWRAMAVFAGVSVVLLAAPWLVVMCCLEGPRAPEGTATWTGTPAILSWSLPSVVLRAVGPRPEQGGPLPQDWESGNDLPHLHLPASRRWLSIAIAAAVLLIGIGVLARAGIPADATPLAMAALVSLALAASPVSWTHYQVLQYPSVALLMVHAARRQSWGSMAAVLALGALLYPLPVGVLTEYYMKYGKWSESLATFYFWDSIAPFASLGLFWLFVREIKQPRVLAVS